VGALYLERPSQRNRFSAEEQELLESLEAAVSGQLSALLRVERICRYQGSTLLTIGGLEEQLMRLARRQLAGDGEFVLLEVTAPGLERMFFTEGSSGSIHDVVATLHAIAGEGRVLTARIASDTLAYGYEDTAPSELEERFDEIQEGFASLVTPGAEEPSGILLRVIQPDTQVSGVDDLIQRLRSELYRPCCEFNVNTEIAHLTDGDLSLKEAKTALEKRYITAELFKSRGNITRAAGSLGVHRPQLSNLIKKHNVRREDFE
jgi:hypothetical protein